MGKQPARKKGPSNRPSKLVKSGHLPVSLKARVGISLPVQLFVGMITTGHFQEFHGITIVAFLLKIEHISLARGDSEVTAHSRNAMVVLDRMLDRARATGKWGATGDELSHLRMSFQVVVEYFHRRNRREVVEAMRYVSALFDKHKKPDTIEL